MMMHSVTADAPCLQVDAHAGVVAVQGQTSGSFAGSGGSSGGKLATSEPPQHEAVPQTAAHMRLCPPALPEAVQALLQQCVRFMQEQSSIGSEALVSLHVLLSSAFAGGQSGNVHDGNFCLILNSLAFRSA